MKTLLLFGLLWSICATGWAQKTTTIQDIDQAFDLAFGHNIDYQNFLLNKEKADIEYKQAKSHRLPTISGTFSGQRNIDLATTPLPGEIFGQPGQVVDAQFGQEYNYNVGLNISKDLFNREAILQAKLSEMNAQLKEIEKEAYEELLKEQVSLYYYTGLIAKQAVEIGRTDLQSARNILQLSEDKYVEGIVDGITLNASKINVNTVNQKLISSEQLYMQCEIELKKLFGLKPMDTLRLEGKIDYELPDPYQADQLGEDTSVKSAGLQLDQAEMKVKLSQSARLPLLQLNSYFGKQQFRNDFGLALDGDSWSNYSFLSLTLSVPIFTGFNNKYSIKSSRLSQQVAMNDLQEVEAFASLNDQRLIADYTYSRQDAAAALETYRLYEETLKLTLAKYEQGILSLDSYLQTFEDYLKAENAYLNASSKTYTYYSQIIPRI